MLGVFLPSSFSRRSRMASGFGRLPLEMQRAVLSAMGAKARIRDWNSVERTCGSWRDDFLTVFTEWLNGWHLGFAFAECTGTKEEVFFLARHVLG